MYTGFQGTFFSHALSLIIAFWVMLNVPTCNKWNNYLYCSQILVIINSAVALFRYGSPNGYKLKQHHIFSLNVSTIGVMTILHILLQIVTNARPSYYVTTALNLIPLIHNLLGKDYRPHLQKTDAIIAMNCLFFFMTAIEKKNFYATAFIINFTFGYFYVKDCGFFLDSEVPSIDLYQYMQCFQSYFTYNAFCN